MTTVVRTAEQVEALPTGERFSIRLPKTMAWLDLHRVWYHTANREVTLTMRDGTKVTGRLDETPSAFSRSTKAGPRAWLYVPGRKSRKGIDIREVRHLVGYKAPSLAEALTAYIYLNSSNPTREQVRESLDIARKM